MRIVFKNLRILYGEELHPIRGNIVVEDGVIVEISDRDYKESIDMKNGLAIPSFTNTHTHIVDRICSDKFFYEPINRIVGRNGLKFECLKKADINEKKLAIKESLKDFLKYATLTFCDFREEGIYGIRILKEVLDEYKILDGKILGRGENFEECVRIIEEADGLGIPDVEFLSIDELKSLRQECKKRGKLFAIHCSETKREFDLCSKLNPDFIIHAIYLDDYDLSIIEKYKIPVVICPRANSSFALNLPKMKELFEITTVAIGTDNVMMNSLNIFREMEYTFKIIRSLYRDYKFDAKNVLKAATINGRKVLKTRTNEIMEGNVADFIILRNRNFLHNDYLSVIHRYDFNDIKVIVKNDEVIFR